MVVLAARNVRSYSLDVRFFIFQAAKRRDAQAPGGALGVEQAHTKA
jgi:hypothetical protein